MGGSARWKIGLRLLVEEGSYLHINCLDILAVWLGLRIFLPDLRGHHVLVRFGQYERGVLHKSPGQSFFEAPLYPSRAPLEVSSAQLALAESSARAGQTEPGSRHAILEQCPLRQVDAPPTNSSGNMRNLRQTRGQPLRLRRQHSLPNLFFKGQGCVVPRLAKPPPLCFSPNRPDPAANQRIREQKYRVLLVAPLWRNQHWFSELVRLLTAAPWPIPLRRDLLSQANGTICHPQPDLWALHRWPLDKEPTVLPENVLNTISQAGAPSTRQLYALK